MNPYLYIITNVRLHSGHKVAQICLIMRPVPPRSFQVPTGLNTFLAYVQRFDIIPQLSAAASNSAVRQVQPDPVSGMFVLKRSRRADGSLMGDIVPLSQCRVPVEVTPRFFERADPHLKANNSLELSSEFWLNKYFDKDIFFALHLTKVL